MSTSNLGEDKNDVDEDGDPTEAPTFDLTLLATPALADSNGCSNEETSQNAPTMIEGPELPSGQERPT